jgi:tripartite-type tricarboxylate transporter receptor subunit TctC
MSFSIPSRRRALLAMAVAGLTAFGAPAAAQDAWPSKPIRLIVTFPPGGLLDVVSRMLAPKLSETLGQPVVVENRPGANGNIGGEMAAKSAPDGYTLLATSADMVAVNPYLYKMSFDPARDLDPITQMVKLSMMIVAAPQYPASDAKSLIAHLKAKPGQSYGTPGTGSAPHLVAENFRMKAGVQINHVPYKGLASALADLMGGQIDLVFDAGVSLPNVRAGKLKLLATARVPRRGHACRSRPRRLRLGHHLRADDAGRHAEADRRPCQRRGGEAAPLGRVRHAAANHEPERGRQLAH